MTEEQMKIIKRIIYGICIVSIISLGGYLHNDRKEKDTSKPVLNVPNETLVKKIDSSQDELLKGVSAKDSQQEITSENVFVEKITKADNEKMNVFDVSYVAIDDNLNIGRAKRELVYTDYYAPQFSITEPLIGTVEQGISLTKMIDANDCIDGNLQSAIKIKGNELGNNDVAVGDYDLKLEVTNSLGDRSVLPVTFKVLSESEKQAPTIKLDNYVVYVPFNGQFDPQKYPKYIVDGQMKPVSKEDEISYESEDVVPISDVSIKSNVDTQVPGVYTVEYKYTSTVTKYTGKTTLYVCVEGEMAGE